MPVKCSLLSSEMSRKTGGIAKNEFARGAFSETWWWAKFDDLYIDDTIHRQRHNATAIRRPSWFHSDSKSIRCTSMMCQYADQTCLIIDSCAEAKWSKQGGRVTKGRDSVDLGIAWAAGCVQWKQIHRNALHREIQLAVYRQCLKRFPN